MPPQRNDLIPTRWTLIQRLKKWDVHEGWREFFDTYWRFSVKHRLTPLFEKAVRSVESNQP
ncbi:MAG TPA: hypothetical protein VGK40_04300 [Verrucomicrobiae bacterium]|jgi:hypothetical protein